VSSFFVLLLNSIPLTSWGWVWAQSNSILGLFESCFKCPCWFLTILQAIQDKFRQAFHLPFDQFAWNLTNKLTWFLFFLLPCWCLCYIPKRLLKSIKGFCSPQEVYGEQLVYYLRGVFTCFMCTPFLPFMGRFFNHLFFSMFNFKESQ